MTGDDPRSSEPRPPHPRQPQDPPGRTDAMRPVPDHGETSYQGSGLLADRIALITGGDSGIGRAVAIAFAREGADVAFSYLSETADADETARLVEDAGRRVVSVRGDLAERETCLKVVDRATEAFGSIDILVNNAAYQRTFDNFDDISGEEWEYTFATNIHAMFYLAKAAVPHMKPGSCIINTSSIQAKDPTPALLAYASTKGAISNFTAGLAGMLGDKGIRVNAVAPGPIWTPLIPATMPQKKVEQFGADTPLGRPGQPAEVAGAYVLLASERGSYINGAVIPVTGGRPML